MVIDAPTDAEAIVKLQAARYEQGRYKIAPIVSPDPGEELDIMGDGTVIRATDSDG